MTAQPRHFLNIDDFTYPQLRGMLDMAGELKARLANRIGRAGQLTASRRQELIEGLGAMPDGDRLWSIVVTSEDAATQTAVLAIVDAGFVLAD